MRELKEKLKENGYDSFIKTKEYPDRIELYTAVKTYEKKGNLEIKLAGDIHLAEENYFLSIINELGKQDKILLEGLIAEELSLADKLTLSYRFIKSLGKYSQSLKESLDLSFRPEIVKMFLKENEKLKEIWELCDLTMKEFIRTKKTSQERKIYTLAMLTLPIMKKFAKIDPAKLKLELIKTVTKDNKFDFGKTISERRNKNVENRLAGLLNEKKTDYKIGVFYGAGHMQEFERYVTENFGFNIKDEQWFKAFQVEKSRSLKEIIFS